MTNETTASQPKSIGDDAHAAFDRFANLTAKPGAPIWHAFHAGIEWERSRAPAAQASATIQAAPDDLVAKIRAIAAELDQEANNYEGDFADTVSGCAEELERLCATTIQEPIMVAEPVSKGQATSYARPIGPLEWGDFASEVYTAMRCFDGTWGKSSNEMRRQSLEEKAKRLMRARTSDAPMVADPAGVAAVKTIIETLQLVFGKIDPKLSSDQFLPILKEVQAAIALAATLKAVPSEALDAGPFTLEQRMPPKGEEVLIYFARSNGKMECRIDEWDDLHEDPISMGGPTICVGEGWISYYEDNVTHWAPIPAVNFAAPLADKTGGGE